MTDTTATTGAAGAPVPSTGLFSKVFHWFGLVIMGAIHVTSEADKDVDNVEPKIVAALDEGVSIAKYIPGINTLIVPYVNAGITLLGAFKATLDGTVALDPEIQDQIAALEAKGFSVVLVEQDAAADIKQFLSTVEGEIGIAKKAVSTLQAAQDVPSSKITAEVKANVTAAGATEAKPNAAGVAQRPVS